jgi:Tol biopolymer transport system component
MTVVPGDRLGPYEIRAPLGAGAMGEVFRAHDSRLQRDVAIKVLPAAFSEDANRVARFEREARVLATLNHPHIAAIYGLEELSAVPGSVRPLARALVLELVEGDTLADRLRHGALPCAEAIAIAGQIAQALDAAHEKGIVHRDLKPANVKITPGGVVKVLDFGLAKTVKGPVLSEALSQLVTETDPGTRAGTVLGTAAYMSPEQARGHDVDKRTDIWAFGCVLYQMLTGRLAFAAETTADTIAAILERDPDWTGLPAALSARVRRALQRCLEKDPSRRARDIADVAADLDQSGFDADSAASKDGRPQAGTPRAVALAAMLVAAAGLAALVWMFLSDGPVPALVTRTTITLPASQQLDISASAAPLALSPDGRLVAYAARGDSDTQLFIRRLDAFEPRPLAGTEGATYPFFSPDGESIAFFADNRLKRVSIRGGSPVAICEAPVVGRGGAWSPDGTIVFDPGISGLMRVPDTGGTPEFLSTDDAEMDRRDLSWPQFLPGGRALLVTVGPGLLTAGQDALAVLSLDSGRWRVLGAGSQPQYLPPGYLVFHAPHVREGDLQAVRFDAGQLEVRGEPVAVLDGVFRSENSGGAYTALAQTGTIVFAPGGFARTLSRVDRNGRRSPLVADRRGFRTPRISPDGTRVAVVVDPRPSEVWVYDLARATGFPLSTEGHNFGVVWTPDGRRVAYSSEGEMYSRAADGSSDREPLFTADRAVYAAGWSPDGQYLVFNDVHPTNQFDIWVKPLGGEPRAVLATPAHEVDPALSPDGRWLAYDSNESGRREIYVRPFPDVDTGKWLVSTAGGRTPVWSPTGDELFYSNGSNVMTVPVEPRGTTFSAGAPAVLFSGPFETGSPGFDISPDGTYFVMVEADPSAKPTQIHVVLNWSEELKRIMPVP